MEGPRTPSEGTHVIPSLRRTLALLTSLPLVAATFAAQTPSNPTSIPPGTGTNPNATRGWPGYARTPQHAAMATTNTQPLNQIHWSAAVDQSPQYSGSD